MRERTRFWLAVSMEFQNGRRMMCVIALVTACMLLFLYSIMVGTASDYHRLTADQIFSQGVERTGVLLIEGFDWEKNNSIIEEIRSLPCINGIAESATAVVSVEQRLKDYPNSERLLEQADPNGTMSIVHISPDAAKICDMKLLLGTPPEQLPADEGGVATSYIYLGYDYRGIPLGEVDERTMLDGTIQRTVVAGVLEKGQRWMTQETYTAHGLGYTSLSDVIHMDASFIECSTFIDAYPIFFNFTEAYTFGEVRDACVEILNQYEAKFSLASCAEKYEIVNEERKVLLDALQECLFLMIVTSCCLLLCMKITEFYQNKRQYGLFYAVGMSRNDMEHIIVWRKIYEMFCPAFFSYIAMFVLTRRLFWVEDDTGNVILEVLNTYCLPRLLLFTWIVTALSAAFSILHMRRYMPTDLLIREE